MSPKKTPVNTEQSEGGRRGGKARWAKLSQKERSKLMQAAARARWGPKKKKSPKNMAAAKMAKLRWAKLTQEEREAHSEKMTAARKSRKAEDAN